ncbi:hypothetical protein [Actinoplanes aureus]|uniref:Uncharacterized protein n=1 Tax=Actinoplanes aureus TaxID=2792083 RepID=A0A931CER6_9ACTN|nr:hypothetical protein [Actinoplanes aureus]MBG0565838.1 hypothetical protein [Actinoplanes aureus]
MNATARALVALLIVAGMGLAMVTRTGPAEPPPRDRVGCRPGLRVAPVTGHLRVLSCPAAAGRPAAPALDRHRALTEVARRRAAPAC